MKKNLISLALPACILVSTSVWAQTPAQIEANIKKVKAEKEANEKNLSSTKNEITEAKDGLK